MKLDHFLDHELRKETMDVVILDEQGNDITTNLSGEQYNKCEIIHVKYELIARVVVKTKNMK